MPKNNVNDFKAWTEEEELKALEIILEALNNNEGISEGFVKAGQELGRSKGSVNLRWYKHIIKNYKARIPSNDKEPSEKIRWSKAEDNFLLQTLEKYPDKKGRNKVWEEVANTLGRTVRAVADRYSKHLKYKISPSTSNQIDLFDSRKDSEISVAMMDEIIKKLESEKSAKILSNENKELKREISRLKQEIQDIKEENKVLAKSQNEIYELGKIIARFGNGFEFKRQFNRLSFQMEQNGNLQVIKKEG